MTKLPLRSIRATLCLSAGLILVTSLEAHADFFKYKDSSGNMIITNRMEDVPKKYRNRVKVIWDKDLEAKDPVARRKAIAREQMEQQERQQAAQREKQAAADKKKNDARGKTLVIEMDESTGELKRRFE